MIIQKDVLAMGVPSSSILSEIFLQYIEASHIASIVKKHMIINYFQYIDDILLIFWFHENQYTIHSYRFQLLHPNLHFTAETEHNIQIFMCRKPTFTDTIILYTSNNPTQHKYAAIRYLYNRLHTYQLNNDAWNWEMNFIHNIL
jgi:hypothetical protein